MRFRFSLETVLRLRRSLEDSERLRLQMLLADSAQLKTEIERTAGFRAELGVKLSTSLQQHTLPVAEMQFALQRARACDLHSVRLHASLAAVAQHIERQQRALLQRRMDRKVLEQVRERQSSRFEADTQRRTQSQMEELFLLRRGRDRMNELRNSSD